jgi:hypothetical protein
MDAKQALDQLIGDITILRGMTASTQQQAALGYLSLNADTIVQFLDETYLRHSEEERQTIFDSNIDQGLDYSAVSSEFLGLAKSFVNELGAGDLSALEDDDLNMIGRGLRFARHFPHPGLEYAVHGSPARSIT